MKRKILLITLIMSLIISIGIISNAANIKKLIFSSDKTEIERGESVEFTLTSKDLTGIQGIIEFEKDVWTLESKESDYSFTENENTGKFVLANLTGEEEIEAKFKLKSSKDSKKESTVIKIKEIVGSDKTGEEYKITDKSITITFKEVKKDSIIDNIPDAASKIIPKTGVGIAIPVVVIALIIYAVIAYVRINRKKKNEK